MTYSTHRHFSDKTNSYLRRRKAPQLRAGRTIAQHAVAKNWLPLCVAFVCLALLVTIYPRAVEGNKAGPQTKGGEGQVQGVKVKAAASAVVNFEELARQQALNPQVSEAAPKAITPPRTIQEVDDAKGEPPSPAPVDIPGPSVPSPAPANNFAGLDDIAMAPPATAFFTIPPDTTGAVGTDAVNKVFGNLNNNYRVQNKTTGATIGGDVAMTTFWAPALATSPFDPRVQHDPFNDRWIVAGVTEAGSATTSILVGVSLTSDPSGAFALFKVPARIGSDIAPVNFADFPMLGFNKNWVVVSINMFNGSSGAFTDGRALVIDYPMLRTGVFSATYFTGVSAANAGFCMHPATTYSATENTEYLVAHLSSAGATYRMHTITGTSAAPVFTLGVTKTRPGGGWAVPGGNILPQAMGTCATTPMKMEASDAQIRNNVVFRNSSIWYTQTVGLPAGGLTHTAAQWTQLSTAGDVLQGGRVEDPTATDINGGKWYAYPSIAANAGGDALLGFSEFSSAQFASSGYTYRDHTDTLGTMRDVFIFKAGEDCYSKDFGSGRNRWGDYSHTMVDPTGNANFWTIQEYAKLQAPPTVGGSTSKWGTSWAKVNALVPTMAKLNSFTADGFDDGRVLLRWSSGYEVDNLGYNIYREFQGRRTKINPQTIAGSALITGPKIALTAGNTYAWADQSADNGTRYYLEDIDLNGKSTFTGPAVVNGRRGAAPTVEQSELLTRIGMASSQMTVGQASAQVERKAEIVSGTPDTVRVQTVLADQAAVKVAVKKEGWYRITQPELIAAGLDQKVDARNLQLYVDGRQVPIIVNGEQDGQFGPNDSIEFYGVGLNSAVTDTHVYWLVAGGQPGSRIKQLRTNGGQPSLGTFVALVERKDRTLYFSGLRNGETENFFGPVVASTPVDQSLNLANVATTPAQAGLDVYLQGVTTGSHQARVTLNGTVLGTVSFNGQERGKASFPIAQSQLLEGANSVQLVAIGGPSDVSLIDTIRISYTHTFNADNNQLRASIKAGQPVTFSGFTSTDIRVMDVTDLNNPQELTGGTINGPKTNPSITLTVPGTGLRSLLAFTGATAATAPAKANTPSDWHQDGLQYDYVMITTRELKQSLNPLKALRESQGLSVVVVDVEDLYDEFSFGNKSSHAVKYFLRFTRDNWRRAPRFVLFAGDSSYDPKNYLGFGDLDLVPTKLYDSAFMEAASDDWFVDFQSTGLPDIASGRLPVRNAAEASAMVAKILRYESSSGSNSVLLAADLNDGHNFAAVSAGLRALLPASMQVQDIVRGTADDATIKSQILAAINAGRTIINYNGHGSVNQWRADILTNDDAATLTNQNLSFFIMMTCLNGYFDDPVLDSLAESLLKASNGAAAVWASAAQCEPGQQEVLNYELYRLLFGPNQLSIGEAAARAKQAVTDPDVRRSWILFGDPAMRLR